MKLNRSYIAPILTVAALLWWIVLQYHGTEVGWEHFEPFGTVVVLLGLLLIVFDLHLWHWRCLHWLVKIPDLRGTWRIEMESDWKDPETGLGVPTIICYMGMTQTSSSLQMHLMTKESESRSVAESVRPSPNGVGYRISGVYRNRPKPRLRETRSPMHYGGILLDTHGPDHRPNSLSGEYWTGRKTTGVMTFTDRVPTIYTKFSDAEKAFACE